MVAKYVQLRSNYTDRVNCQFHSRTVATQARRDADPRRFRSWNQPNRDLPQTIAVRQIGTQPV